MTQPNGRPIDKKSDYDDWSGLLKAAGVRLVRLHDGRHTAATLLLTQGVHPKVLQERLGHAAISMTLDIYSHLIPSMGRAAADQLDALFA